MNKVLALTISPSKILLTLDKGGEKKIEIIVFNESDDVVQVKPTVLGVEQTGKGILNFKQGLKVEEDWVLVGSNNILLYPNERQKVEFNIQVPESAYPGSYYLGLGINSVAGKNNSGVAVSSQLVSLLHLQVAGVAQENLRIVDFSSSKNFYFKNNFIFNLSLRNIGNVQNEFKGEINLKSFRGDLIATEKINENNKILPDILRNLKFDFKEAQVFWPGIYQVGVDLNYGLTGQQLNKQMNFWYLPVWSLFVLGLLVLLIIGLVLKINRNK